jgi:hypothetical protein
MKAEQLIIANNSSLALMHDSIVSFSRKVQAFVAMRVESTEWQVMIYGRLRHCQLPRHPSGKIR